MIGELMISSYNENLVGLMSSNSDSKVKATILSTLGNLKYENTITIVKLGMEDESREVRIAALGL
jgi:quinoprotein glucose dehydrogenase